VADTDQTAALFANLDSTLPPLRGVIHAAGVLDDGILLRLTPARMRSVMTPKVAGASNLHRLTLGCPLDFFVLFSSAAALLGSPGQGNYAAGNAFLDALAQHRHAQGLPALSINWGPWSGGGLAAVQLQAGGFRGIASLTPQQGLAAFERAFGLGLPQVAVMGLDLRQWRQSYPKAASAPFLSALAQDEGRAPGRTGEAGRLREALLAAGPDERRRLLEAQLRAHIGQVLRLDPAQIDPATPLPSLGFDSLMALELRNRLEAALDVTLSATLIWGYPTIAALTPYLGELLGIPLDGAISVAADPHEGRDSGLLGDLLTGIDALQEDEAIRALSGSA
jgi:acyl carrier protein